MTKNERIDKIVKEKIEKIIEAHQHWCKEDCSGWQRMRADFSSMTLKGANLAGANLAGADLAYADLSDADLSEADLAGANLTGADLTGANLAGANLRKAALAWTILGEKEKDAIPEECPRKGAFIGYKKAYKYGEGCIVKLKILESSERSSATGKKCRCDAAKVLSITAPDGTNVDSAYSNYDPDFCYKVGAIVKSDFEKNRFKECAPGIHFFMDYQTAANYNIELNLNAKGEK